MAKNQKKVLNPIRVGNAVLIRTVTHYHTGRIVKITKNEIVLVDAAWVASTGRFTAALTNGTLEEVEPFPGPVAVNRGAIVDVTDWVKELPSTVK